MELVVSPPSVDWPATAVKRLSSFSNRHSSSDDKVRRVIGSRSWLHGGEKSLCSLGFEVKERRSRRIKRRGTSTVASLGGLLGGIFKSSDSGESTRQTYSPTVALINGMESEVSSLSDAQLREKTAALQERARGGDSLDSLLPVS